MYCPKCKCEYREGFTVCSDCHIKLVDSISEETENISKDSLISEETDEISKDSSISEETEEINKDSSISEETEEINKDFNVVKIKNVASEIEAKFIMDLLENNNIPCYKKSKGAGDYLKLLMGYSVYGIDIYVAEKDYDKAKDLLV